MDGFNEKKWFIYVVDHHEGPFSAADLSDKLKDGSATTSSYLWAEGMADWKQLADIPALQALSNPGTLTAPSDSALKTFALDIQPTPATGIGTGGSHGSSTGSGATVSMTPDLANSGSLGSVGTSGTGKSGTRGSTSGLLQRGSDLIRSALTTSTGSLNRNRDRTASQVELQQPFRNPTKTTQPFAAAQSANIAFPSRKGKEKDSTPRKSQAPLLIAFLLISAGVGYYEGWFSNFASSDLGGAVRGFAIPIVSRIGDYIPFIGDLITPFDKPEGVSTEDYEEMKAVAKSRELSDGPRASVAVAAAESANPVFYVASNMADGTPFKIHVEGAPDTLLNQMELKIDRDVTINHKLGKALPLTANGTQPIPRGQYTVTLISALTKPVKKVLFLGGPRDAQYTQRLKAYHDALKRRADGELMELRQFQVLLESRYGQSLARFNAVRKAKKPALQAKLWQEYAASWDKMQGQITATFQKWTPQTLATEYFYGKLYETLVVAGQALDRFHQLQQNYFKAGANPKALDSQLADADAGVRSALGALKAKLEAAANLTPTPNGMPRREGL